ncbi:hypothetical protein STANM309S_01797 [Streptomyces tanashiensis]
MRTAIVGAARRLATEAVVIRARVTQVRVVGAGRVAARGLGTSAGVSMLLTRACRGVGRSAQP